MRQSRPARIRQIQRYEVKAAIDRLVHHCVIIELNIPSYRVEEAKKKQQTEGE
jgi:hypothetical protein